MLVANWCCLTHRKPASTLPEACQIDGSHLQIPLQGRVGFPQTWGVHTCLSAWHKTQGRGLCGSARVSEGDSAEPLGTGLAEEGARQGKAGLKVCRSSRAEAAPLCHLARSWRFCRSRWLWPCLAAGVQRPAGASVGLGFGEGMSPTWGVLSFYLGCCFQGIFIHEEIFQRMADLSAGFTELSSVMNLRES